MSIYKVYHFVCNGSRCGRSDTFGSDLVSGIKKARSKGWAVSRDRTKCYCPACAPDYRPKGQRSRYGFSNW